MRPLWSCQSGLAAWDCVPGADVEIGATGGVLQPPIVINKKAATRVAIVVTSTNVLEIVSGGELIINQFP